MPRSKKYEKMIYCSKETYNKIMIECINLIYEDNPALRSEKIKLNHDFILDRIATFFINEDAFSDNKISKRNTYQ